MTRSRLAAVLLTLLTASVASAQTFRQASGPWTRAHELVGSVPDGRIFARVGQRLGVTTDAGRTWTVVSETTAPTRLVATGTGLLGAFPDGVRVSVDGGATWVLDGLAGQAVLDIAADGTRRYALTAPVLYANDGSGWQPTPTPPDGTAGAYLSRVGAGGGTLAVGAAQQQCSGIYGQAAFYRSRDGGATWARTLVAGAVADLAVAPNGTAYLATTEGQGCLSQTTPGGLFEQAPGAAAATLRSGGDTGGVAIDAAGQPVTLRSETGLTAQVGGIAIAGDAVVFATRPLAGYCFDPPCGYLSPSGLYARRGERVEPVGFVRSRVRALTTEAGMPIVASDGAVYRLDAATLAFAIPLGNVRAFVPVPWVPGTTLALSGGASNLSDTPFVNAGSYPLALPLAGSDQLQYELRYSATASATVLGGRIVTASQLIYRPSGILVTSESEPGRTTLAYRDLGSVGAAGETTVYAGAVDGITSNGNAPPARLFRSDDRGDTWTPDAAGMTARDVFAFTSVGAGLARLDLAGTNAGVFARTPGAPWAAAGLDGRRVLTFYAAPDGLVAGTDDGLFVRDAAGAWTRYGTGLDGQTVYAVLAATDASGAWLGVGTDAGLYQTRAFGVAGEPSTPATAARLAVSASPNPARGVRTLRVRGAQGGSVAVAVFDGLGRRVADLGLLAAPDGHAEATWDAGTLPSGVYVVRATAASGTVAAVRVTVVR